MSVNKIKEEFRESCRKELVNDFISISELKEKIDRFELYLFKALEKQKSLDYKLQKEEIIKEIEKEKKEIHDLLCEDEKQEMRIYNKAIDDILKMLN